MNKIVDVASAVVGVGALLVLTRPGSQGPGLLSAFFSGFAGLLGTAVGSASGGAAPLPSNFRA